MSSYEEMIEQETNKNKARNLPNEIMEYIKKETEQTEFGSVSIQIQGNNKNIDIITEKRKRFQIK